MATEGDSCGYANTLLRSTSKKPPRDVRETHTKPKISNHDRRTWSFNFEDSSPIQWWRTMLAEHLGHSQVQVLRSTLDKICVMNGREWLSAMRGDAAASIAIAVDMSPVNKITLEVDLAMTVLMVRALDGNAAASLVLSYFLGRAPLDHPFSKELSASWLVLNSCRATRVPCNPHGCWDRNPAFSPAMVVEIPV